MTMLDCLLIYKIFLRVFADAKTTTYCLAPCFYTNCSFEWSIGRVQVLHVEFYLNVVLLILLKGDLPDHFSLKYFTLEVYLHNAFS